MTRVIPFAGPENDVHVVVFPRVGHVRQIFVRAVEINVVVVIAVEEIADLKGATQADKMTDGVGMPESDVGGVIRAQTCAADSDPVGAAFAPREIEYFTHDNVFVGDVSANAIGRVNRFVVKTVEINRIRAIDGHSVVIREPGDGIDQAKIFVLAVVAKRGWKNNQWETTAITEDQHLELAAQIRGPPLDVTFLHKSGRIL